MRVSFIRKYFIERYFDVWAVGECQNAMNVDRMTNRSLSNNNSTCECVIYKCDRDENQFWQTIGYFRANGSPVTVSLRLCDSLSLWTYVPCLSLSLYLFVSGMRNSFLGRRMPVPECVCVFFFSCFVVSNWLSLYFPFWTAICAQCLLLRSHQTKINSKNGILSVVGARVRNRDLIVRGWHRSSETDRRNGEWYLFRWWWVEWWDVLIAEADSEIVRPIDPEPNPNATHLKPSFLGARNLLIFSNARARAYISSNEFKNDRKLASNYGTFYFLQKCARNNCFCETTEDGRWRRTSCRRTGSERKRDFKCLSQLVLEVMQSSVSFIVFRWLLLWKFVSSCDETQHSIHLACERVCEC